jgi:uncharacterized protein (TIRG00374 family)
MDADLGANMNRAKKWFVAIGGVTTIICGYLAIRNVSWRDTYHALANVNFGRLSIAILFLAIGICLSACRWQLLIGRREARWATVVAALLVGLMVNNILPARLGEIARAIFLGTRAELSKVYLVGTVVLDRLMDLAVLIGFALLLFISASVLPSFSIGIIVAGGVLFGSGIILIAVLRCKGMTRMFNFIESRLPAQISQWFADTRLQLQLSLVTQRSWQEWIVLVGLSLGVWFFMGVSLFFALQGFNIDLSLHRLGILLVVLNLGGLIPSSPGYIGTYHWLAVTTLAAFGVDRNTALGFALVNHALWYVPQISIGLLILLRMNLNMLSLLKQTKR